MASLDANDVSSSPSAEGDATRAGLPYSDVLEGDGSRGALPDIQDAVVDDAKSGEAVLAVPIIS